MQSFCLLQSTEHKVRLICQKRKRGHSGQNRREEIYITVAQIRKNSYQEGRLHILSEK